MDSTVFEPVQMTMAPAPPVAEDLAPAEPLCLIVTNNFPPSIGGAGNVYAALATAARGRVAILAAARDYRSGADLHGLRSHDEAATYPMDRIREVRPVMRNRPGLVTKLLARGVEEPVIRRMLWRRVRETVAAKKIRVLCIADDETVGWMIKPAQKLGLAVILYVHGDDLAVRPGAVARRIDKRRRAQFKRADAVITVSEAAACDLEARFGVPRARMDIVLNGIDTKSFRPQAPEPALVTRYGLAGRRVIVTVSRLVQRKGIDTVIRALPTILAALPDVSYLILGDGPYRAGLEELADRYGVTSRVAFAGEVGLNRVPAHLALGDVFAMPNRRMPDGEDEGFGLVFLEANAVGLPVLGGRAGGVPEVVRDGETGLLVDGTNVDAVAQGLLRLLTDGALRAKLTSGGRAAAAAADWGFRAKAFLAVCERVAPAAVAPKGKKRLGT